MRDNKKELEKKLRNIYNDEDFIFSTNVILNNDYNRKKMLDYIMMADSKGDAVTSEHIILLAMRLRREYQTDKQHNKQAAVAML